jgi:hypothetical protein
MVAKILCAHCTLTPLSLVKEEEGWVHSEVDIASLAITDLKNMEKKNSEGHLKADDFFLEQINWLQQV